MIYFDTDVLIHSLVKQNTELHNKANDVIETALLSQKFLVSWLSLQEIGFVLAKLNQPVLFISSKLNIFSSSDPLPYGKAEFARAIELAEIIGFKDFNDCLHTAIAEQNCTDFYTCNYRDFSRIQPLTKLHIHFLTAV